MARKYVEEALDAVYNYLVANLNTMLGTVRTEKSSAIPENYAHIAKRPNVKQLFPRVTLFKDYSEHNYGREDEQPLIEPWIYHNFVIYIEHRSSSLEAIDFTLMRYTEAINRMQEDSDTFGGAFVWVQIGREDWTPVFTDQKTKQSIQGVMVPIECRTI